MLHQKKFLGMVNVSLIEKYLNTNPDIQFSIRLRRGFVDKYTALRNEGFDEDALFYALLDFASNNSQEFRERTAGLSILAYFFERCMGCQLACPIKSSFSSGISSIRLSKSFCISNYGTGRNVTNY